MHFKEKINNIFQHLLGGTKNQRRDVSDVHIRSVFFGDYMAPMVEDGPIDRLYNEITDMEGIQLILAQVLLNYRSLFSSSKNFKLLKCFFTFPKTYVIISELSYATYLF